MMELSTFAYFPFVDEHFTMGMGVRALDTTCLIEVDSEHYQVELAIKRKLLTHDHAQYFQAATETLPCQWEVLELLLPAMVQVYPQYFSLTCNGAHWHWRNALLGEEMAFLLGEDESLPLPPLDWLGRQVQEDLLILSGAGATGMPLIAGQLCFPNDWCLADKMGKSFLAIHQEVPHFAEQLGRSSQLLLERLKVGRPVWRLNWAFKSLSRLNLTPNFCDEVQASYHDLSVENIGLRCYLRVERQVLVRLPRTKALLFSIHTYQTPVASVADNPVYARRMAGVVRGVPSDTILYKGMAPFADLLLAYLETRF